MTTAVVSDLSLSITTILILNNNVHLNNNNFTGWCNVNLFDLHCYTVAYSVSTSGSSPVKSAHPDIVKFWKCLKSLKWSENDKKIELDLNTNWMKNQQQSLYIREHYTKLFDILITNNGNNKRMGLVLGNPGTGQLEFIIYKFSCW